MTTRTSILISIVIVTYNRAELLKKAINSLLNQTLAREKYEILVVDNASTDETKQLVLEKCTSTTNVRYIYEAKIGANNARNVGWQQALGQYIAYLDDDAVPSKIWLERILAAFENITPKPGIVGGRVNPIWETAKPSWIKGKLLKALSVVDYSPQARFLEGTEFLYSVNMCFQKDLLARFNGFNVDLGRKGKKLISNDEILIAIKIKDAGYKIYYDPLIAVDHLISSSRLNYQWFIKRYYQQGYSDALMWILLEKPNWWLRIKKILYYFYGFLRNPSHIFHLFFIPSNPDKLFFKLTIHARVGYIKGLLLAND